ncbi:T9SS type A sorting domain-containing protein [Psychroserpens sp.]
MKHIYFRCLFFFLFSPVVYYGQVSFESIEALGKDESGTAQLNALADLDGDGDLDIITEGVDLIWYENTDGLGTFAYKKVIFDLYGVTSLTVSEILSVDMDGDSDLDVLVSTNEQIVWIENMDGLGNFDQVHIVNPDYENARGLDFGDLDGDGDIDVISANYTFNGQNLSWYENLDGDGNMGDEQIVTSLPYNLPFIKCADVDSDGDLDIVASKGNIVWYENLDGNATFSSQNVIGSPYSSSGYYHFVLNDLDDDGDIDVIVPNGYNDDTEWYENFGGSFSSIQLIGAYSYDIGVCEVGDFNGDGYKDVITNYQGIRLRLNNGDETFTNGGELGNINFSGIWSFNVGDIDNDGDLDILAATHHNLNSFWLENNGGTEFISHPVGMGPIEIRSTLTSDIDNDGDLDIIVGSSVGIYWFENTNGNLSYDYQHFVYIDDRMDFIFLSDLDSDGNKDIIGFNITDDELVWFQNEDGNGSFGPKIIISTSCDNPTMAVIGDIDGDGDSDIILSSRDDNKVAWYNNIDGLGNFGSEQIITSNANGIIDVKVSDIDGDGDLDIIVPSTQDDKISWFENTNGFGFFSIEHVITNTSDNVKSVSVNDIDGDGDMDILSSSSENNNLAWYENTDGNGTFDIANSITSSSNYPQKVSLADVDNDGDLDALIITGSSTVYWYENMSGSGDFDLDGEYIGFSGSSYANYSISDIDFDGDVDILSSSGNRFTLYKNLGVVGNEINGSVYYDSDLNGCQGNAALVNNVMITTSNVNDSFSTFTDVDGSFQLPVNLGDFSTSVEQLPMYYDVSPMSYDSSFTDIGTSDSVDYCLTPNSSIDDLNIAIIPLNEPRPGFEASYELIYKNVGTNTLNGTVTFEYDNSKMQFGNANETLSSQTVNTISFNFADLNPFQGRSIELNFQVFTPPTTNIDDVLVSTATINPLAGDYTENDNVFELEQVVIGSYDPNDITCLQGDVVRIEDADKYLYYLVRFQNTGTADAINVKVEQELDDKLDWATLKIESLSHRGNVAITNGSNLVVTFNAIHLSSSTMNEPESHGYIVYKIKPQSNVDVGDVILGTADIYFDFNPAIITNTADTVFVENLSIEEYELNFVSVFPNPTNNELFIVNKGAGTLQEITIVNIEGRLLISERKFINQRPSIDLSNIKIGLYFVTIKTTLGIQTFKIIKK